MSTRQTLTDLRDRLARAEQSLYEIIEDSRNDVQVHRLGGKREGVALALSYVEEILRAQVADVRMGADEPEDLATLAARVGDMWDTGVLDTGTDPFDVLLDRLVTAVIDLEG